MTRYTFFVDTDEQRETVDALPDPGICFRRPHLSNPQRTRQEVRDALAKKHYADDSD